MAMTADQYRDASEVALGKAKAVSQNGYTEYAVAQGIVGLAYANLYATTKDTPA